MKLPILPFAAYTLEQGERLLATSEDDPFPFEHTKFWGPRVTWLLHSLLSCLNLERSDEVAILTTSDWTYVSTCLSLTVFNFTRVSRIVTDATKVVIVVHEFGYAFPDIAKKCEQWRSHGLLIIEDCAHLVGLDLPEGRVGSFGDFVLVSLPKILPTTIGGLMLARRKINFPKPTGKQEQDTLIGQAASERFLFHHKHLSSARIARHEILKSILGIRIWEPTANAIPFASYVKKIAQFREIPDIEFLSTLSESFLLIPTNPFVDTQVFSEIAEVL